MILDNGSPKSAISALMRQTPQYTKNESTIQVQYIQLSKILYCIVLCCAASRHIGMYYRVLHCTVCTVLCKASCNGYNNNWKAMDELRSTPHSVHLEPSNPIYLDGSEKVGPLILNCTVQLLCTKWLAAAYSALCWIHHQRKNLLGHTSRFRIIDTISTHWYRNHMMLCRRNVVEAAMVVTVELKWLS